MDAFSVTEESPEDLFSGLGVYIQEGDSGAWKRGDATAMRTQVKELLRQALSLDEKDRAALAGALIESLYGEAEPGAQDAWEAVIERRVEELETGAIEAVPWSEVRERLFRGYE